MILISALFLITFSHKIISIYIPGKSGPFFSSCQLEWHFPRTNCLFVKTNLIDQVMEWHDFLRQHSFGHQFNKRLRYYYVNESDNNLIANYLSTSSYINILDFKFQNTTINLNNRKIYGCLVKVKNN